ncbi:MAG: hypothetical protein ACPGNT_11240, partial [Rhodospirillales bacterium]
MSRSAFLTGFLATTLFLGAGSAAFVLIGKAERTAQGADAAIEVRLAVPPLPQKAPLAEETRVSSRTAPDPQTPNPEAPNAVTPDPVLVADEGPESRLPPPASPALPAMPGGEPTGFGLAEISASVSPDTDKISPHVAVEAPLPAAAAPQDRQRKRDSRQDRQGDLTLRPPEKPRRP